MNIALIADDGKKELMVQFCIAYCGILAKHELCSTFTTGRLISEATGLKIRTYLHSAQGCQQLDARIAYNEIDLVLFFCDAESGNFDEVNRMARLCDQRQPDLILTTGGTGFSPRDITPEATCAIADRNAPGIAEAMRYHSLSITPRGMLSRGVSVLRGKTLIVNLPGSPKAVHECLEYILPALGHGLEILKGTTGNCAR